MLRVFLWLYLCNLILDYPLQGDFLGVQKSTSNYLLWVHSAIWGLGISAALIVGAPHLFTWWKVIMLVVGHFVIDYLKCRKVGLMAKMHPLKGALYVDQVLHVLQLVVVLL